MFFIICAARIVFGSVCACVYVCLSVYLFKQKREKKY